MRTDDPKAIQMHEDRFFGSTALIVLGGPSGKELEDLHDEINPDVLLTANGINDIPADYWMLGENMNYCNAHKDDDLRLAKFMRVLDHNEADTLLVNHRSWNLLPQYPIDEQKCISIRRWFYPMHKINFRKYGNGYLKGPVSQSEGWKRGVRVRLGTVGLQLLHHAALLGCDEVHTIGFDLAFKTRRKHHWYQWPRYEAAKFRRDQMFVEYKGVRTQEWWLETADYLIDLKPIFERAGMEWYDHSDGLLEMKGAWCAV